MNILHVCSLTNNQSSGIANVVPEHFINQSKLSNVALLNCNSEKNKKLKNLKNVFYLNELKKSSINYLPHPFNNPSIAIFHGIYIPQYIRIAKELKNKKIPYIIIPHGSLTADAQKIKPIKKIIGNIFLFNTFIKEASSIQYLSESEQEMSSSFKNESFVLGNGMNKSKIKKQTFSENGLKLIYVGRYDIYHKGIDKLIDACTNIKDYMIEKNISLTLYGTGGDGIDKIKKMVSDRNMECIISVNGPIFETDKIKKIIENDLFIQTSRLEGQPLGIMEALTLGMPIIVTKGTTFAEIVNKEKLGYVGNKVDELSNIIKKIYENKIELSTFSKNSIKYSENNFLWDKIAKKSIEKYKKIIEER